MAIVAPACPPPLWGGGSTRIGCFSAPRWRGVQCLQRRSMSFERVGSEEVWSGRIASVRNDRFRHADGEVVDREVISHPGAVAVVAHDGEHLWLVRQPREAVDEYVLELPAGKLDGGGGGAAATPQRGIARGNGKGAKKLQPPTNLFPPPGFSCQ